MASTSRLPLALLLLFGCSHSQPEPAKPADPPPVAKPADPPPKADTFANDDEYIAKGKEAFTKLIAIFKSDGTDCEKLAADVTTLAGDPMMGASKKYETDHPDIKTKFESVAKDMESQFEQVATPALNACSKNKSFVDALGKLE